MAKRRGMSYRKSKKNFRRGTRVHPQNGMMKRPMRGGIRL